VPGESRSWSTSVPGRLPHPSLIVAVGMVLLGMLLFTVGLILHSMTRRIRELEYQLRRTVVSDRLEQPLVAERRPDDVWTRMARDWRRGAERGDCSMDIGSSTPAGSPAGERVFKLDEEPAYFRDPASLSGQ